jgi:hypothetical protein
MEESLELREFLDVLGSPAFILDLSEYATAVDEITPGAIQFAVVNKAARESPLGNSVISESNDNTSFRQWLLHPSQQDAFEGANFEFTSTVLRGLSRKTFIANEDRYKIIQTRPRSVKSRPQLPGHRLSSSWAEAWSHYPPQRNPELHRQHLQYLLSKDWSKTAMGPLESWPQSLRTISSYVMNCPFPCALYWGEDLAVF